MNDKKKLGQFFTDPYIAEFMVKLALDKNTKSFLDPAVGPGIFIEKAHDINKNLEFETYEVDKKMILKYEKNIQFNTKLNNTDYLYSDTKKFDAIVCNPPYNKFQEIDDRVELIKLFEKKYGIKLSGYSNYCIYFLIKSLQELNDKGKCVYIIPYEFMNTGYGEIVKKYILETKLLNRIIKFDSQMKLFSDAMTTSCILLFEKKPQEKINFIDIKSMSDFEDICNNKYDNINNIIYDYSDLKYKEKWSKYFKKNNNEYKNLVKFSEYAKVKRGIATGNNNFFNINKSMIKKHKLSDEVCIPCITKSPDIKKIIMTQEYYDELVSQDKKMYVFDGRKAISINDKNYIMYGEEQKVNKSYLNSHRVPWYGIEDKAAAPIWISVFSRDRLKIIRNEIMIKNLTTFHGIYPNDNNEENINIFFCYLQTPIAQKILRLNKREYGEGLDKFEPNDLNNAMILDINKIKDEDRKKVLDIYLACKANNILDVEGLNTIFSQYIDLEDV